MGIKVKDNQIWECRGDKSLWRVVSIGNDIVLLKCIKNNYYKSLNLINFLEKYKTNSITKVLYTNNSNI